MNLKKLLSATLLAGSVLAAGSVAAFPVFTVNATEYGGSVFNADKITGGYDETLTFTSSNTFDISLLVNFGQFFNTNVSPQPIFGTGLGSSYQLYALFLGNGTFNNTGTSSNPNATFSLNPGGSLQVFVDPVRPLTTFTQPATGSMPYNRAGFTDDVLLATGAAITGNGELKCVGSNNCGSFGQTTSFNLTPAGQNFFVAPVPFYNIAITTGQFNGFPITVGQTIRVQGSADTVFGVAGTVPEPSSIALFGLALVGLAFIRRRNQA